MKTHLPPLAFRHPDLFGFDLRLQTPLPPERAPAAETARHDFLVPNLRPDLLEPEPPARFTLFPIDLP